MTGTFIFFIVSDYSTSVFSLCIYLFQQHISLPSRNS